MAAVELLGCDFSSSPSPRKHIVLAWGVVADGIVVLHELQRLHSLQAFAAVLAQPRSWVGAFDLPFGLPRSLVETLGWPQDWRACIRHMAALDRRQIRDQFAAFCAARPVGQKFAHRACDHLAGSSPSMKWVNPPVAYMLHAGVPLLLDAGVDFPGLHLGDSQRVALEGYPGLLAREVLDGWQAGVRGTGRRSYKSDDKAKQTPQRAQARHDLVQALEAGQGPHGVVRLGLRLQLNAAQRQALVADASGDVLDAVLCMLQAGWAAQQHAAGVPRYGLPQDMDPLEGWIISV
ncbi:hypothetical protein J2X19_002345 [Rhodoferax ferrireducens]|uniref:DUF429 domain-containing protein n=1 Tax=Rhodoferax ferrireducens TaxID=192843 RepID=A0ABU2C8K8_9BURK|nr:DUF429 domain-containing protein [Rhodoferax ferrireducens]MDR7377666.1 hypothetical protein [Rhodoferax ferrireducens]